MNECRNISENTQTPEFNRTPTHQTRSFLIIMIEPTKNSDAGPAWVGLSENEKRAGPALGRAWVGLCATEGTTESLEPPKAPYQLVHPCPSVSPAARAHGAARGQAGELCW